MNADGADFHGSERDLNGRTHMNHGGQSWLKELQKMACESVLIRKIRVHPCSILIYVANVI